MPAGKTAKLVKKPVKRIVKKPVKKPAKAKRPVKRQVKKSAKQPVSIAKPVKKPAPVARPVPAVRKPASSGVPVEFKIKVENVVAFAVLGVDISLDKIVKSVEDAEYEPEQFPGLVYRTTDPRAAALIFSSGKIVCTGAKSIESSKVAMRKVVDKIRSVGIRVPKDFPIDIENIVASSKICKELNLEEVTFALENAEYEPEQFPGLVYRITEPRVAFLLFSSGKIICTGAHSLPDIKRALEKLREKLESIGVKIDPNA